DIMKAFRLASDRTVRRWIQLKRLPQPVKIGRRWYWKRKEIEAILGERLSTNNERQSKSSYQTKKAAVAAAASSQFDVPCFASTTLTRRNARRTPLKNPKSQGIMSAPTTSVNPDGLKQCKKNARSLNDGRPASKPKIVAIYDYCDEKGNLLFQVVRFDPKDFRQRRPNGKGGFTWGLGDTRRVLYRLPELVKAHPEETIFLAEGERDVDNLVKLGCVATTSPMGAGNWRSEYNGYFRDRQVVILPDNDEAGRKYAQQVAEGIYGAGADVTILELPDLPKKGDISDWIDAGGDKDKLIQLAKAAPAFRPVLRFEKPSSGSSGSDDEEYPNPFRVVDDDRPI